MLDGYSSKNHRSRKERLARRTPKNRRFMTVVYYLGKTFIQSFFFVWLKEVYRLREKTFVFKNRSVSTH